MTVRTRFAPSPTGSLHIGNVRSGLFAYLYARHHHGQFVLRIDDTDRERSTKQSLEEILADLDKNYPGLKDRVCDESGNVRRFVNIFINDEDIRFLDEKATVVKAGDEISIVPAIAGG